MGENLDNLIPTRQSLLTRLKQWDDHESWRDFFDTYWRLIYAVALKSGLSESEAQEVVQETVIGVANSISDFKTDPAEGSFKAWLLRLTRWRVADQFRKRRHQAGTHRPRDDGITTTSTFERIADPAAIDLEKIWDAEWEKNIVNAAIENVKKLVRAKQYQIFHLSVIKGQNVQQVVKSLGVNAAQVYLARHRISRLLKKEVDVLKAKMI